MKKTIILIFALFLVPLAFASNLTNYTIACYQTNNASFTSNEHMNDTTGFHASTSFNATCSGTIFTSEGLKFDDDSADACTISDHESLQFTGQQNFTVTAQVNFNYPTLGSDREFMSKATSQNNQYDFNNNGQTALNVWMSGADRGTTGAGYIDKGVNHSYTCVYNGSAVNANRIKCYRDSTEVAVTITGTIPTSLTDNAVNLILGKSNAINSFGMNITMLAFLNTTVGLSEVGEFAIGGAFDTCSKLLSVAAPPPEADTTPPVIINYSSQGDSCTYWNTNTSNPCTTSDIAPSIYFNTSESAFCAIGVNNFNYTAMGSSRNCTVGEGTTEHQCDLTPQDELVYEDSIVYLSCKDSSGNMNTTSTSGPLSLIITGLEAGGDNAIGTGIQNALLSGYTNYTEVQIYARNLANNQTRGTFDRMTKKGSKVWAFNYVTKGQQHVNMFNLTPVLYVLEMSNITNTNITKTVETMINATK